MYSLKMTMIISPVLRILLDACLPPPQKGEHSPLLLNPIISTNRLWWQWLSDFGGWVKKRLSSFLLVLFTCSLLKLSHHAARKPKEPMARPTWRNSSWVLRRHCFQLFSHGLSHLESGPSSSTPGTPADSVKSRNEPFLWSPAYITYLLAEQMMYF